MSEIISSAVIWRPVIIRGFLFVAIAFLSDFLPRLKDAEGKELTSTAWIFIVCSGLLQSAIALRCYMDGSLERKKQEISENQK